MRKLNNNFLRVIPTKWHFSDIFSDILCLAFNFYFTHFLTFYLVYRRRFFVVEARRGTLWSGARGGGPAGNTLIWRLLFGSGGEHCDRELAVEVRRRKEEEGGGRRRKEEEGGRRRKEEEGGGRRRKEEGGGREEGGRKDEQGGPADIKSNNPHLTAGEKKSTS